MAKKIETKYSWLTGIMKTCKNLAIIWGPAILAMMAAFQANAPAEYAAPIGLVVSGLTYFVKNYVQNK
jgi:hypothetical protein